MIRLQKGTFLLRLGGKTGTAVAAEQRKKIPRTALRRRRRREDLFSFFRANFIFPKR